MPSVSSLPPYLLFLFLLSAVSLRVCPLSNLFHSWWISVCSTNRLPGRTARVLKRSKTDRTLSELEETSWYHVYRGCRQEAVKPIGLHSQKKNGGYWLSHIAHHLRPVTWHGSTRGLVQNKHFLSQFLDALSWMKQRFLCQNHCWKWPLMNQTLLLFPVMEMLLCYHPFIFCPACKACIVWHLMEDDNDCAIKNHNLPIRHSSFSSFRC